MRNVLLIDKNVSNWSSSDSDESDIWVFDRERGVAYMSKDL